MSEYRDKFASFDGTNDWFRDKSVDANELGEVAQCNAQHKQDKIKPVTARVRKEAGR